MWFRRNAITPSVVFRRAQWVMAGTGGLAVAVMAAWLLPGLLPSSPEVLAVYLTLLLLAVGSGCVALLAACHLAIHEAFSAGFQTGQVANIDPLERAQAAAERGESDPVVRLVK